MKKIVLTTVAIKVIAVAVIMFAGSNFAFSQKYGYIDSNLIDSRTTEQIPDSTPIQICNTTSEHGKAIITYEVNP